MTTIALACCLVVGAAAVSILGRDSVPEVAGAMVTASAVVEDQISNREIKADKLIVAAGPPAPAEPSRTGAIPGEPVRQAFAASAPAEIEGLKLTEPPAPSAPPKPKVVNKPPLQKPYALLSDAQIASIKERLKLSSSQESYWPAVENALRAVARKIHATRQADPNGSGAIIDPEAAEVQQLKSAAMPLLVQLREDQKREVRTLARLIGLEKVAAAI
jgi:glycine/D-amino acid oxidase-like deaminating enzyme